MIKKLTLFSASVIAFSALAFISPPKTQAISFGIVEIRSCGTGCYDVLLENGYLFRMWT